MDAAGNATCYYYDALHRINGGGYNNVCRRFYYDSGTPPSGITVANTKTRLIEISTDNCGSTKYTDEFFSYDKRGALTDVYESTPHSGGFYHSSAAYWPNGSLNTLSLLNSSGAALIPLQTYGVDSEGRTKSVSAASGQNPVTSVTYSTGTSTAPLGALTGVTFGSADSDAFTYDPNTGRMATYTFSVNNKTDAGTLTWNANGTLQQLIINDQIPSTTDSGTCTYGYDDVQRISNVSCGTFWVQNFTYDAFGNITKNVPQGDGGQSFLPSYWTSPPTNQFASLPGVSVQYDANGNLLTDNLNSYTWDSNWGTMSTVTTGSTTVSATYDALGRMVENNAGGSDTEFVYGPTGKLAKCHGQNLLKAFVALPGGAKAVYTSSGLSYYRHSDWLGSSRLTSTSTAPTSMYSSSAYAPFGEQYKTAGTADASYTGQDQDTVANVYDFAARRQSPSQGRWISPDPAGDSAAVFTNPQTWNRYAHVVNNPLTFVDPTGMLLMGPGNTCIGDAGGIVCGGGGEGGSSGDGGGGGGGFCDAAGDCGYGTGVDGMGSLSNPFAWSPLSELLSSEAAYVAGVNQVIEDNWLAQGFIVQRGPGGVYYSMELAGAAAAELMIESSNSNQTEYGGTVYMNPDGTYGYSAPGQGPECTDTGCTIDISEYDKPIGSTLVGIYHTHPDVGAGASEFGTDDIESYVNYNPMLSAFLGTSSIRGGYTQVLMFDPGRYSTWLSSPGSPPPVCVLAGPVFAPGQQSCH